ncbi:EFR1 family ferrodoxin [Eubacteriaceae bacterium Marseille-Q4139]|nr:EFR1 family ferrodoxin [Eubacteriaceae bacterium Marseille-Q4139]
MDIKRIWAVYFSPTGGTKKAVTAIAGGLSEELRLELQEIDFTLPESREKIYAFGKEDLAVIGTPVYAGRVPNKLLPDVERCFTAAGAYAIPVSVYGNRSFDDGLMELKLVLESHGFRTAAAAAIVSQHAFSRTLAVGRPDAEDLEEIRGFAKRVADKIKAGELPEHVSVKGNEPVGPYYTPLAEDGTPAKFLKAKPLTDADKCDRCGICAQVCPMGSIDRENVTQVTGICIKCQACVKKCPRQAKYFVDEQFLSHVRMLEKNYTARACNSFFEN